MDELAKEDHTYHLSPEEYERYQGQWYLTLNKSGKNGPWLSLSKIVSTASQANKLKNPFLQNNTGDGILVVGQISMELEVSWQELFLK